jgi:autotransporter adhesin
VSSGSTQAVNGSQLYTLQQELSALPTSSGTSTQTNYSPQISQIQQTLSSIQHTLKSPLGDCVSQNGALACSISGEKTATASGAGAVAVGAGATANFANSTALGTGATIVLPSNTPAGAKIGGAVAIGDGAIANADPGTALGDQAAALGANSTAVGYQATATGTNGAAYGYQANAAGANATAVGTGSTAIGAGSVAIGAGSVANRADSFSVGSAANNRQITHVAAGTKSTDAANVGQVTTAVHNMSSSLQSQFRNESAGVLNSANAYTNTKMAQIGALSAASTDAAFAAAGLPGINRIAAGVGEMDGQTGEAVAYQHVFNKNWDTNITVAFGAGTQIGAGAGFSW